ncbi:S-layer family protein [Leptolyngbya cf. ectocarpi LEGE 11479]|uniref:S-layer family protein n=1 Tax=Leptolyngbya cf. ectocarpi LEGE 11479 TaxID=1828722 RepID=A0A928ZSU9_LEPEC|nr:S-layer family protein [Leptolyngbya ectocarpi]MBE9066867.1 S-layer family protein [Leptolyngbya cf. ectocarpi LEGE 11479]
MGQGGSVDIVATDSITISGTSAALTAEEIASLLDLTGLIDIAEGSDTGIFLRSGISAFSLDQGDADSGSVRVTTNGSLIIQDNAEITTTVLGGGNANNVEVSANSLELRNSARINSRNEGTGFAGDISVATQGLLRSIGGEVSASSDLAGGGDINITTDNLLLSNGSLLSTSVFDSTGGGGDITIDANAFAAIEDSDILANAEFGPGGTININSPAFLATLFESGTATPVGRNPGSFAQFRGNNRVDISADSAGGQSGTVSLSTLVTDEGLNELPTDLIDPTSLIDQRCDLLASQQSQDSQTGQFTVVGRGGLPLTPEQQLEATQLLDDLGPPEMQRSAENVSAEVVTTASAEVASERIVEPLGWRRSEDGRLYLYASASVPETAETHLAQRCGELPSASRSSVSSK